YQERKETKEDRQSIAGKGESDSIRALAFRSKEINLTEQFTRDPRTFLDYSTYSNSRSYWLKREINKSERKIKRRNLKIYVLWKKGNSRSERTRRLEWKIFFHFC